MGFYNYRHCQSLNLCVFKKIALQIQSNRKMTTSQYIKENLEFVKAKMMAASLKRVQEAAAFKAPTLVAVSKTKPVDDVIEAYHGGQRHFGENYIPELGGKSTDPKILEECPDIRWHMIGHLQSNKMKKLASVQNLYMVETIDSVKIADALNKSWVKLNKMEKLKVMVQVKTSDEESKNGVEPSEAIKLAKFIIEKCSELEFCGLMTIGASNHDVSLGPNPDFLKMIECHKEIICIPDLPKESLELSMGMSSDYEHAIELGSTNVRVGSLIFGSRAPKHEKSSNE
ncbi:pyridoxal phosphate homeostasis protein-like [Daphnia pulicaria]|uniref:pyridoxal phosphate homeostasis protein-like n=1 Tax=Daphnia pulicaria TaxID=35523 RepID=UPI001EEA01CC|nr:pyridoxal phosphate homeostasis protein-like [Daphnia pulicaria]XP_046642207.1 pyridoxal phosphate homeostasis protein-like [Daphnia pulicaria]